jgi:hypothetical protein
VVELEGLMLGVNGKRGLWVALQELSPQEPVLSTANLSELIARADRQLAGLEEHRRRAVV